MPVTITCQITLPDEEYNFIKYGRSKISDDAIFSTALQMGLLYFYYDRMRNYLDDITGGKSENAFNFRPLDLKTEITRTPRNGG